MSWVRETHPLKLVYPAATYLLWLTITEVTRTPFLTSVPQVCTERKSGYVA